MMMNVLALGLVLSSIAAASVWSPQPGKHPAIPGEHRPQHPPNDAGVVREGHRLIVLEYEREAPQQPPSVTTPCQLPNLHPLEPSDQSRPGGVVEEAKERLKEGAPGRHEEGVEEGKEAREESKAAVHGAKEKICDAYGVCKEKVAGLFGKSKEKAAQLAEAAKETAAGAVEEAKELKEEVAGNISEAAGHALDRARGTAEKAREMERGAVEKAKEMERGAVEKAKEAAEKAGEVQRNATEMAQEVRKNFTDILRRAREVAYDAATYVGPKEVADGLAAVVQLLAFATAYGTCVWVTFVSSHILARALPRQQFGVLQSKLYPVYFRGMAYAVALALLSHAFGPAGRGRTAAERVQRYVLLTALVLVLVNMHFLEPKATKVMFERMKMEKEEGRGRDMMDVGVEATTRAAATSASTTTAPLGATRTAANEVPLAEQEAAKCRMAELSRRLKRLNSYSSMLNVMTLMGLTWHLVHLSRLLQAGC